MRPKVDEQLKQYLEAGKDAFSAQFAPETINADQRTVDVVWFTSIDVPRYDWRTDTIYMRRFDPKGADLSLLNNGAPVIDNHFLASASDQKGVVERAWVDGKNYKATLRFSKRPEVDGLWQDIQDGIVQKFSMGVEILNSEDQKRTGDNPLVRLATQWRPFEISVAPIPADFGTTTMSRESTPVRESLAAVRRRQLDVLRLAARVQ